MDMPKAPRGLSDRYELLVELGRGASSARYVGRPAGAAGTKSLVFVRVMSPTLLRDPDARDVLLRDARATTRLRHSNANAPRDVEAGSDRLVVVSDHLEGGTLREASGARLSVTAGLRVVLDACAGLHALHELEDDDGERQGLVHADVSPGSIFVGADGLTRITRIGIGRALTAGARPVTERLAGRLAYAAPERLRDEASDRRADVFSLAVVAWEVFAGEPLFGGGGDDATVAAVLQRTPRALGLPGGLDDVLARGLAKAPEQRFATVEELADALHFAAVRAKLVPTHREVAAAARAAFGARLESIRSRIARGPEPGLRGFSDLPPPAAPPARKVATEPPPTRRAEPGRLPAEATPSTKPPGPAPTRAATPSPPPLSAVEVDDDAWGDPTPSVPTLTTKPPPKEMSSVAPPAPPPPAPLPKATLRMGAPVPKTKTTPMMPAAGFPAPTPRAAPPPKGTQRMDRVSAPSASKPEPADAAGDRPDAARPTPPGASGAGDVKKDDAEAAEAATSVGGGAETAAAATSVGGGAEIRAAATPVGGGAETRAAADADAKEDGAEPAASGPASSNPTSDSTPPGSPSAPEPRPQRPSLPPSPWARRSGASAPDEDARAGGASDAPAPTPTSWVRSPVALAVFALALALSAFAIVRFVSLPPAPAYLPPDASGDDDAGSPSSVTATPFVHPSAAAPSAKAPTAPDAALVAADAGLDAAADAADAGPYDLRDLLPAPGPGPRPAVSAEP